MRNRELQRTLQHAVLLIAVGAAAPVYSCEMRCTNNYSMFCNQVCGRNELTPAQIEKMRKDEAERQKRSAEVIAAFKVRRDKLHVTDPSSAQFKAVFAEYQKARRLKDGDLLGAYLASVSQNMLGTLLTGGANLVPAEAPYEMSIRSRKAFREYAMDQMNKLFSGTSILSVLNEDGSVASSDSGTARGTYGNYVFLADKGELAVWKEAHGVADEPYPPEPPDPAEEAKKKSNADFWAARNARHEANKPYSDCMQSKIPLVVDGVHQRYPPGAVGEAANFCKSLRPKR